MFTISDAITSTSAPPAVHIHEVHEEHTEYDETHDKHENTKLGSHSDNISIQSMSTDETSSTLPSSPSSATDSTMHHNQHQTDNVNENGTNKNKSDVGTENETMTKSNPSTSHEMDAVNDHIDQSSVDQESLGSRLASDKGRGRALDLAPTVMSAEPNSEPAIFVTAPPADGSTASSPTAIVVKGKSLKDLSDVSMDDVEDVDIGNNEKSLMDVKAAQIECKEVSSILCLLHNF